MQEKGDSPPRPSSLACLACRRRHVKCDALMPACTRCRTNHTECQYVRSKRGLRKNARNTSPQLIDENVFSTVPDTFPDWLDDAAFSTDRTLDVRPESYTHLRIAGVWRIEILTYRRQNHYFSR